MTLNTIETKAITITEEASVAVKNIFQEKELDVNENYLRVYISGQSCSGYQYGLGLETDKRENDLVFEENGVKVLVDDVSIEYMKGSIVDFVNINGQSGFKVENPTVNGENCSSSGCGGSC